MRLHQKDQVTSSSSVLYIPVQKRCKSPVPAVLLHIYACRLSLDKSLQQLWEISEIIVSFLEIVGKLDAYFERSDNNLLLNSAFPVGLFSFKHDLNMKLR